MVRQTEQRYFGRAEQVERALTPWTHIMWFAFLIVVAVLLPHSPNRDPIEHLHFVRPMLIPLVLLWVAFLVEFAVLAVLYGRRRPLKHHLWAFVAALVPPLRLSVRPAFAPNLVWLPGKGWREANNTLVRELEHTFNAPMIGVALLILPILALEMLWADQIATRLWLLTTVEVAVIFIWLVFALEFFTMIAVHNEKFAYCKAHWIDLLIILLPLVAFLRVLRVARLARLTRLERMTRVYRMRGLLFRTMRALVLINLLARVSDRFAHQRLGSLRKQLAKVEEQARQIREDIAALEAHIAQREAQKNPGAQKGAAAAEQGAGE